jgi:hypothetical protein
MIGKDRLIWPRPGPGGRSPIGREPENAGLYGTLRGLAVGFVLSGLGLAFLSASVGGGLALAGVAMFVVARLYEARRLARRRDLWRKRRKGSRPPMPPTLP